MKNVYWNQDRNQKETMPGLWPVLTAHPDVPVWTFGVPTCKHEGHVGRTSPCLWLNPSLIMSLQILHLRIKPIILHKLTSSLFLQVILFFISQNRTSSKIKRQNCHQ